MTSTLTPHRAKTASTNASRFGAWRSPAVPTATMSSRPTDAGAGHQLGDGVSGASHRDRGELAGLAPALPRVG